ncbi:MAG: class I tRNA ligase family protein, partial [Bacteroidota bacterium]
KFRISDALMNMYKLIWDEFCSNFLELMKPERGATFSSESYARVISLFEEIAVMAHPFIPFITEEIWQNLREREKGESVMRVSLAKGDPEAINQQMLKEFELITETVTGVRAFKNEKQMGQNAEVEIFFNTKQPELIQQYELVLKRFLNATEIGFADKAPAGSGSLRVRNMELYIPLTNVDVAAEIEQLKKDIEYTEGFLNKVNKKLSNERFVANAPEAVVANERKKQADGEAKLKLLRESLAGFESMV